MFETLKCDLQYSVKWKILHDGKGIGVSSCFEETFAIYVHFLWNWIIFCWQGDKHEINSYELSCATTLLILTAMQSHSGIYTEVLIT